MTENEYEVRPFTAAEEAVWDDFVENQSVNGTFLQTRRFLNYHPAGRFTDASYMIYDAKGHLAAVCPACVEETAEGVQFISHKGSTFGGVVYDAEHHEARKLIAIVAALDEELKKKLGGAQMFG